MKKLLFALFALVCAGVLGLAGAYFFWLKTETDKLRGIQAQVKENGLPTSEADFFPHVPLEDRNAAPLLREAAELVKRMPKDSPALRCAPGSFSKNDTAQLSETEFAAIRDFLAEPAAIEVLKLLSEAARKEECYFARDYAKGINLELPDAATMLPAIRLLLNHSWSLAEDGDVAGAVGEINSGMKICEFYMNAPFLITWLVGVACEQMCLSAIMDQLAKFEVASREVDDWEKSVKTHRKMARTSLARALDGERIFFGGGIFARFLSSKIGSKEFLSVFGMASSSGTENWKASATFLAYQYPLRPLLVADFAAYLRFMLGIRKVILDPNSGEREAKRLAEEIPRTALLTRLTAPSVDSMVRKLQEIEISLDLSLVGLRAEKFRIANGHYPQSPAEIPWEGSLPPDPFTGKKLHYKATGENILIYSVGPDLVDNQGNPRKIKRERDIVWSVQRSPRPADSK